MRRRVTTRAPLTFRDRPGQADELVTYPAGTVAILIERTDIDDENLRRETVTNFRATRKAWEAWFRACVGSSAETRQAALVHGVAKAQAEREHQGRLQALDLEKQVAEPVCCLIVDRIRFVQKQDLVLPQKDADD